MTTTKRNEQLSARATNYIQQCSSSFASGGNVEQDDFVRAVVGMPARELDRIVGVTQVGKADALDHPAHTCVETHVLRLVSVCKSFQDTESYFPRFLRMESHAEKIVALKRNGEWLTIVASCDCSLNQRRAIGV